SRSVTPRPRSSFSTASQSGNGRSHWRVSTAANRRRSSSSSLSSATVSQFSPAAAARSRYSFTVERAIRTLRDTAVSLSPSPSLSRSTSLIRRIATFGLGISPPPKRGDSSRHYLPLSSEARADQGCRKPRNQVPDWSEIPCRFPPKSPAAFDRNQVPVCSDFCTFPMLISLSAVGLYRASREIG